MIKKINRLDWNLLPWKLGADGCAKTINAA